MRNLIAALLAWLLPPSGERRAAIAPVSTGYLVTPWHSTPVVDPVVDRDTRLVRPYVPEGGVGA
ncbi:hypothetical protein GCM10027162_46550 [Streptomyces incanus]